MLMLASSSPRRKEILSFFSIPFKVVSPKFDERTVELLTTAQNYALEIAVNKAKSIENDYPNDIILSFDTIVYANNKIYTKPENETHALEMLKELSNIWHSVFTSVCVVKDKKIYSAVEETNILFHSLDEDKIKKYHKSFYFSDKAAGYAIQKSGSIIIKQMIGCYYNVMGLPINTLNELLLKVGIDLWDYLDQS